MDYQKLSAAIKLCGSTPAAFQCLGGCSYYSGGDMTKCIPRMTADAATAIADLLARAEAEEAANNQLDETVSTLMDSNKKLSDALKAAEARAEKAERNAKDIRARWIIRKEDYGVSPLTEDRVEHVKYTCSNCGYKTGTQAEKFACCPMCTARIRHDDLVEPQ